MKYAIVSAVVPTADDSLNTFLLKSVTIDGVASMSLMQLLLMAKSHAIYSDTYVEAVIDVPVRIQAIADCQFEVLENGPEVYKNIVATSLTKLAKGKNYIISVENAKKLQVCPELKQIRSALYAQTTLNEGDQVYLQTFCVPYFVFTAYQDTLFQNTAGSVDVIQMDIDLNGLAQMQQKSGINARQRKTQLLNFPQ